MGIGTVSLDLNLLNSYLGNKKETKINIYWCYLCYHNHLKDEGHFIQLKNCRLSPKEN